MPFPGQVQSITGSNPPATPTVRKRNRTVLIEDNSFVVKDQVPLNGTITFTVTASGRKRYSGNIINDGTTNFQVQIETTRKWLSDWITLKAGDSLDFDRYPLSSVTLKGTDGKFTFSGWAAGERYGGYVKRISSSISSSSTTISQSEIIDANGNILGLFPTVGGAFAMPIRQLTAALDTVLANQGTTPWTENLTEIGGTSTTGLIDTAGPQIVTLPKAKGKTSIVVNGYTFNATSIYYTVPAATTFFLESVTGTIFQNVIFNTTNYGFGYWQINRGVVATFTGQTPPFALMFPAPIPFPAGTTFGVYSSLGTTGISVIMGGFTE